MTLLTQKVPFEKRLWPRLVDGATPGHRPDLGPCLIWTGGKTKDGYGTIMRSSVQVMVHRAVYEALVGPIPAGKELDHLCRNRACARIGHLEPVGHRENVVRGVSLPALNAAKTHCPRGHSLAGGNLFVDGDKRRHCRECKNERERKRYHRAKKAREAATPDIAPKASLVMGGAR